MIANPNTLKVIRKKESKVTDPPRYPEVINGYEGEFKSDYVIGMNSMIVGIVKSLTGSVEQNNKK